MRTYNSRMISQEIFVLARTSLFMKGGIIMSKKSKKGKSLEFSNMIVSYDYKQDVFHITSQDKDLIGKSFKITLNNTSDAEETLRKLFKDKGIIEQQQNDTLPHSPAYEFSEDYSKIPLGLSYNERMEWNINKVPNLLVEGQVGSGASVIVKNVVKHCEKFKEDIDLRLFGSVIEYSASVRNKYTVFSYPDEIISSLTDISALINDRYEKMIVEGFNNNQNLSEPFKTVIIVVQDYDALFDKVKDVGMREHINYLLKTILRKGRAAGVHVVIKDTFSEELLKERTIIEAMPDCVITGNTTLKKSHIYLGSDRAGRGTVRVGCAHANFTNDRIGVKYPTLFSIFL